MTLSSADHWYVKKPEKKTIVITRMEMLYVIYTKYELGEITFLEFKDRIRAINLVSEWAKGFQVLEEAYARFRLGSVTTPEINSRFLKCSHEKKFSDIDSYGVDDFPLSNSK